jgi:hypothetical protein
MDDKEDRYWIDRAQDFYKRPYCVDMGHDGPASVPPIRRRDKQCTTSFRAASELHCWVEDESKGIASGSRAVIGQRVKGNKVGSGKGRHVQSRGCQPFAEKCF